MTARSGGSAHAVGRVVYMGTVHELASTLDVLLQSGAQLVGLVVPDDRLAARTPRLVDVPESWGRVSPSCDVRRELQARHAPTVDDTPPTAEDLSWLGGLAGRGPRPPARLDALVDDLPQLDAPTSRVRSRRPSAPTRPWSPARRTRSGTST